MLLLFRLLTCRFTTEAKLSGPKDVFDLASNQTYLLLATGPSGPSEGEPLSYHGNEKVASSSGIRFDRFVMVGPVEQSGGKQLVKAHGILGIVAWMACAPVGMLFARSGDESRHLSDQAGIRPLRLFPPQVHETLLWRAENL